jgi:hypothetical protein
MNQIKELEKLAIDAFRRGETWSAFWEQHGEQVKQAEPWNARDYHRLYQRLMALVCSGNDAGQYPIDVGMTQWELDDAQTRAPISDTQTNARCLWTPEVKR